MDCSGRLGVPPSLYCDMCMALFHPECVGFSYLGRHVGFLCKVKHTLTMLCSVTLNADEVYGGDRMTKHCTILSTTSWARCSWARCRRRLVIFEVQCFTLF